MAMLYPSGDAHAATYIAFATCIDKYIGSPDKVGQVWVMFFFLQVQLSIQGPYAGRRRKYIFGVSINLVFRSPILAHYLRRSRILKYFDIQVERR